MAKQLVEEGVSIVELCGGFGYTGAKAVSDAVGDKAPVGMVAAWQKSIPIIVNAGRS